MPNFLEFLNISPTIGYIIVFFGAIIEGELIILTASALAATGYLSISNVGLIAFFGTLFMDQILYFFGHRMYQKPGKRLSERYPKLYQKSKKAVILLRKYDIWFILSFRFIYGIRAISPIVIALCGIMPKRFIPLNFVAAVIWTIISCGAGYWLGDFLFDKETGVVVSGNFDRLKYTAMAVLLLILVAVIVGKILTERHKNKKIKIPGIDQTFASTVEKEFYEVTNKESECEDEKDDTGT